MALSYINTHNTINSDAQKFSLIKSTKEQQCSIQAEVDSVMLLCNDNINIFNIKYLEHVLLFIINQTPPTLVVHG